MIVVHSIGPYRGIEVYWGVEYHIPTYDTKHVSYAWLVEDSPPFRHSRWGCRIRVGSRGLHLGTCRRGEDPYRRDIADVDEISQWRRPHVAEERDPDPGGEPLRPDEPREPVPHAGVGA